MNIMGKLNASTEIIPIQGPSDNKKNEYKFKTNFRPKKNYKHHPYFVDPLLVPRVKQYLEDHKTSVYVDIEDIVTELQRKYRDYAKRKRAAFKGVVEKAFSVVLQSCGLADTLTGHSSDSSEELYSDELSVQGNNTTTEQLMSMYMSKQTPRRNSRANDEDKELINISSDEEEIIKKSEGKAKGNTVKAHSAATATSSAIPASQISNLLKSKAVSVTASSHAKPGNPTRLITLTSTPVPAPVLIPAPTPAPMPVPVPVTTSTPAISRIRKRKAGDDEQAPTAHKKKREVLLHESKVTFRDMGGISKVLKDVCKLLVHIRHPEVYEQLGVSPPRGFLLHGPPGCGKTLLAHAIAGELEVPLVKVAAPELVAGVSGESEERIRDLFDQAVSVAPCVLFLDEVDAITPNRHTAQREMERRIVAQLLSCLDELGQKKGGNDVLVIGATNRPEALDPALRRAGRFDREVCLGIPDEQARVQILKVLCSELKLAADFDYSILARNTPGFVGADLMSLTREAAMAAVDRVFGDIKKQSPLAAQSEMIQNLSCEEPVVAETDRKSEKSNTSEKLDKNKTVEKSEIDKTNEKSETNKTNDSSEKSETDEQLEENETNEKSEKNKTDDQSDKNKMNVISEENETNEKSETNETNEKSESIAKDDEQKLDDDKSTSKSVEEELKAEMDSATPDTEKVSDQDKKNKNNTVEDELQDEKETDGKSPDEIQIENDTRNMHISDNNSNDNVENDKELTISAKEETEANSASTGLLLEDLLSWLHKQPPLSNEQLGALHIEMEDFMRALKCVQPSAKREGFATVPDVTWDDVGSLQGIREELQMAILAPVRHSEKFAALGISTPTGVLLCGPPGCGKTLLAKAVANEAGINFISVKGPELLNMYVGESEKAVRQCFQRARNSAPCVIFFDELDALCPKRSDSGEGGASMRVVNQMLTEMDGIDGRKGVFLMAASNRPDIVDPAVLRPGRLDKILYVGLPDSEDRVDILRALTKGGTKPCLAEDVNLEEVGRCQQCEGYTGADLAALVREAGVEALKEYMASSETTPTLVVANKHFRNALAKIRPSVPEKDQKHYEKLRRIYSVVPSTSQLVNSDNMKMEVSPTDTSHLAS